MRTSLFLRLWILLLAVLALCPPGTAHASPPSESPAELAGNECAFGICFIGAAELDFKDYRYHRALDAGAEWTRWPMYWSSIETSPGTFNYSAQDATVVADVDHSLGTNAILMNTPSFYGTSGSPLVEPPRVGQRYYPSEGLSADQLSSAGSPPQGLYSSVFTDGTDVPGPGKTINSSNRWARFVYTSVNRYKPGGVLAQQRGWTQGQGVRHWEMWNEPDFALFWSGSVPDYLRLLKVGYLAAHHADPQAQVLMAGLSYWNNQGWFPSFLNALDGDPNRQTYGYYFDVSCWHWYSRPSQLYTHTNWARSLMEQHGIYGKRIWVNETNVPVWNDYPGPGSVSPLRATMEEQAAYVIQAYAWGLEANVERIFTFQLYDDCVGAGEAYGLNRNPSGWFCFPYNGTSRPSYTAYRVACQYLDGATARGRNGSGGIERMEFELPGNRRVRVVWNATPNPKTAYLPALASRATLVDQAGNTSTIYPSGGQYVLPLPVATCNNVPGNPSDYMIGGKPYLVIEDLQEERIYGQVFDNRGLPVSGVDVNAVGGTGAYVDRTDLAGAYEIHMTGHASDSYDLSTQSASFHDWPARQDIPMPVGGEIAADFYLAPQISAVTSGDFEAGSTGWTANSGAYVDSAALSGQKAMWLGRVDSVDGAITQTISIPAGTFRPTLSFMYNLTTNETARGNDWLEVAIIDGGQTHYLPSAADRDRLWASTNGWKHQWYDLTPFVGKSGLQLVFRMRQDNDDERAWVYLDEISVGKASGGPLKTYLAGIVAP